MKEHFFELTKLSLIQRNVSFIQRNCSLSVHKNFFPDPQSNKDWCYRGICPTISASRTKTAGMIIFEEWSETKKAKIFLNIILVVTR